MQEIFFLKPTTSWKDKFKCSRNDESKTKNKKQKKRPATLCFSDHYGRIDLSFLSTAYVHSLHDISNEFKMQWGSWLHYYKLQEAHLLKEVA